ncbi:MAG: ABC transporter ATP-binding protein, partial [Calditrichaeota bacterium]|nr:ABC transporter ATP-binding protein [Calditrichota bacterium]
PNGSGKSTLIKSLLGLLKIQAGTASVLGHRLPGELRAIRDRVGYLPEDDCFISGLTGIESVRFMARLSGLPEMEGLRRAHEVLDFADIAQERYRNVETYSTGMRQKLKFAQALVHDPQLLILDEPTSGLDPNQILQFRKNIKELGREKTILLSTHILQEVDAVADRVLFVHDGRLVFDGTPAELKENGSLETPFYRLTGNLPTNSPKKIEPETVSEEEKQ